MHLVHNVSPALLAAPLRGCSVDSRLAVAGGASLRHPPTSAKAVRPINRDKVRLRTFKVAMLCTLMLAQHQLAAGAP